MTLSTKRRTPAENHGLVVATIPTETRWSDEDIANLRRWWRTGWPVEIIARNLNRSQTAVRIKAGHIRLPMRSTRPGGANPRPQFDAANPVTLPDYSDLLARMDRGIAETRVYLRARGIA